MDKFYRGFYSGILAAIPLNAWSFFSFYVLKLTKLRMLDWAGMILFGSLPHQSFQVLSSLFMQLVWSGFRGILFSYLFSDLKTQGYLGKAVIFSLVLSFGENAIVTLYKVPHLTTLTSGTVLSADIGAAIWGLFLAYFMRRLDSATQPQKAG